MGQSGVIDKRGSDALNIFNGNRTVMSTLDQKWTKYGAAHGYFYGEFLEVLLSALGYADAAVLSRPLYTEFEVSLNHVLTPPPVISNWSEFVTSWVHLSMQDVSQERFAAKDALVLVDVPDTGHELALMLSNAKAISRAGGKIFVVQEKGKPLPREFGAFENLVGVNTSIKLPFLEVPVDQSLARFRPERIFVSGTGLRVITTALSSFDHLLFHQGGKAYRTAYGKRVIVDKSPSILAEKVSSFEEICKLLDVAATWNTNPKARFGKEREAVYLTAVQ